MPYDNYPFAILPMIHFNPRFINIENKYTKSLTQQYTPEN